MNLQQLRYIWAVNSHDLNISATAKSLFTSQSGISKQIGILEDELGVQIFRRTGKRLVEVTLAGQQIVAVAGEIIDKIESLHGIAKEFDEQSEGNLTIATTHTQARYVLPPVIQQFIALYPQVSLHMHQGTPVQISEAASKGTADFALATEALELFHNLIMMPCYRWNRSVIVLRDHPLTRLPKLTLAKLAEYPLVTYVFGFTGRSQLDRAFNAAGYTPKIVFTATDADVIKTYVKLGLGIGIIASMAFNPQDDKELVAIDASALFEPSITRIGFRRSTFLRGFMYKFIELFAPHLNRDVVNQAISTKNHHELNDLFADIELPTH